MAGRTYKRAPKVQKIRGAAEDVWGRLSPPAADPQRLYVWLEGAPCGANAGRVSLYWRHTTAAPGAWTGGRVRPIVVTPVSTDGIDHDLARALTPPGCASYWLENTPVGRDALARPATSTARQAYRARSTPRDGSSSACGTANTLRAGGATAPAADHSAEPQPSGKRSKPAQRPRARRRGGISRARGRTPSTRPPRQRVLPSEARIPLTGRTAARGVPPDLIFVSESRRRDSLFCAGLWCSV